MNRIATAHTQDLADVLAAARVFFFSDRKTSIQSEMFRAAFGGLFCAGGSAFGDKLSAYDANKNRVPEVLAEVAAEIDRRAA